jgi:hypothetical protein
VVRHLRQVEDVDGHVQVLGEGAGQGRLAGAGRTEQQPAALPGDALVQVPAAVIAPQLDFLDQVLDPLREDEVVQGAAVVQRRLAELIRRVRQQAVETLLIPRQAVAAVAAFLLLVAATGDSADDEAVSGDQIIDLKREP